VSFFWNSIGSKGIIYDAASLDNIQKAVQDMAMRVDQACLCCLLVGWQSCNVI